MFRTKISALLIIGCITVGATTVGCKKKYEDGPGISLTSRTERVANTWIFSYALEDGQNVSSQYDQYELFLNSSGDAKLDAKYSIFGGTFETTTDGTWVFTNEQQNLKLDFQDNDQDGEFKITRLTKDELWLVDISRDLEIHLLGK